MNTFSWYSLEKGDIFIFTGDLNPTYYLVLKPIKNVKEGVLTCLNLNENKIRKFDPFDFMTLQQFKGLEKMFKKIS